MSFDRARDIVGASPKIAALPAAYVEITQLLDDPHADFDSIGAAVSHDPAMSAQLLRMVNSSFFGRGRQVHLISHAVGLVGRRQLRQVALSTMVIHMFRMMPESLVDMDSFWRHSLATGLCARGLGKNLVLSNEQLFTAGLLHDVGSLVILMNRPKEARRILTRCAQGSRLVHEVEREVLGCDHAEVGAALLECWGIGGATASAVAHHHHPMAAKSNHRVAALVHVADVVVSALQIGSRHGLAGSGHFAGSHAVPASIPASTASVSLAPLLSPPPFLPTSRLPCALMLA